METEIILGLSSLASAIVAALAWIAKIRWSSEFAKAKDETIRAKEAQIEVLQERIESLKDFSPTKLREHYLSVKEQLEEYNNQLESKLSEAENEISKLKGLEGLPFDADKYSKALTLIREMEAINKQRASTDQAMLSSK